MSPFQAPAINGRLVIKKRIFLELFSLIHLQSAIITSISISALCYFLIHGGRSRSRERYRDRDNGRSGQEANLRSSSRGHDGGAPQMTTAISTGSSAGPTVVLAGSRSFSGQLPTILQSRDRADERTSNYEDAIEGSRDSGDTSSIGDSESGSAFDGLPGTFGTAPRHGSRGSKSRQIVERRERDGRREGKWERKHS